RIAELEQAMAAPGFWDVPESAHRLIRELNALRDPLEAYENLRQRLDDAKELLELAAAENEPSLVGEIEDEVARLQEQLRTWELSVLLDGRYDAEDAIISLHSGAGGTESQD